MFLVKVSGESFWWTNLYHQAQVLGGPSHSPLPPPLPHPPGAHVTPLHPRLFTYKFSSNQENSLSLSETTGVVCIGSLVT